MASPDFFASALKMLAALGIVLGGMFVTMYLAKRYLRRDVSGTKQRLVRVLASQYIGVKKQIALVEVPGTVLVLGVTNDNIRLLTELKEGDLPKGNQGGLEPAADGSFASQLAKFTAKFRNLKTQSEL